jgi:predicted esterase
MIFIMNTRSKAEEVEQQYDHLVQAGAYAEALELATREAHVFPEHAQKVIYSWRMDMACRLKNKELALQLLQEAVDEGYWYGSLKSDPDYALLYGEPEFERLVEICEARRAQAMANAVPVVKVLPPEAQPAPYPLLLALHGANASNEADHWISAVSHGWLVCLPQSSQQYAPGTYTWNDWEWAQQEVLERYAAFIKKYPVDPGRIVLAGFSQGAGLAAWLVLSGKIQVRGLVLVGPFLPDIDKIHPLLDAHPPKGFRVYLAAGQRDRYCLGIAQQLAELLPRHGIVCQLDVYPDMEHRFPVDFEKKLPEALDFVERTR